MIRYIALWSVVAGLAWYARKDWWVSLCGLILLMTVIEHPDAPKSMFGVQGLNPWNLVLVVVVWAWLGARKKEGLTWDMPKPVTVMLLSYLAVIVISFARMIIDPRYLHDSTASLTSEHLVNAIKWTVPGLLLFDGCRTRKRFNMAVVSILSIYVLLGLYVIKWMPLGLLTDGEALERRALKILVNEVGYHRVNMSMMLAGAAWAIFASRHLAATMVQRLGVVALSGTVVFAQALTGGRMGYVTWGAVGLILCTIRGRGMLLAAPVVVMAISFVVPAAADRLAQGFDPSTSEYATDSQLGNPFEMDQGGADLATVTAGRILIWPYVQAKIAEAPLFGYGRLAMRRTGLTDFLARHLNEGFSHPHNAYLEMLFDNGIVGFIAVLPFYVFIVLCALRLYADSRSPVFMAIGGIAAAMTLSLLVAAMGSQTFYPREGAVGMWCSIGLLLRVWVERGRVLASFAPPRRPFDTTPARPAVAPGEVDARLWNLPSGVPR